MENFDKNLYVDVYELRQKLYEQMYTFFLSNKVNTETAGYKSQNFQAFLFLVKSGLNCTSSGLNENSSKLNCTLTIKLPIHVRYHSPKIPLGDAYNESSLTLVAVSSDENSTELFEQNEFDSSNDENDEDRALTSGETNGYFRFSIRKPRLFFTPNCSFNRVVSQQPVANVKPGGKKSSSSASTTTVKPSRPIVEYDLPCRKNKSIRNDYLFMFGDDLNATNFSSVFILNKYSSVCKWREYKFEQVDLLYFQENSSLWIS